MCLDFSGNSLLTLRNSVAAHILRHSGHIVTFPPGARERSPGRAAPLKRNSGSCFSFTCGSSLETELTHGPDIGHYIPVCGAITSKAAKISSRPGSAADKMLCLMALRLDGTEINLKYQHVSRRPLSFSKKMSELLILRQKCHLLCPHILAATFTGCSTAPLKVQVAKLRSVLCWLQTVT